MDLGITEETCEPLLNFNLASPMTHHDFILKYKKIKEETYHDHIPKLPPPDESCHCQH